MANDSRLLPKKPTERMIDALTDKQTPYVLRLAMENTHYEIVRIKNKDWREVMGETDVISIHHDRFEAKDAHERIEAEWRYKAMLRAAPRNKPKPQGTLE